MYQLRRRPNMMQSLIGSGERRRCSNEAKTRNRLKFAGCCKLPNRSQSSVGRSSPYCGGCVEEILLFNKFFFRLPTYALIATIQPHKVLRWCADGDVLTIFASCKSYFTASCVQHISDLHSKFALRPYHVWKCGTLHIQFPTAENR